MGPPDGYVVKNPVNARDTRDAGLVPGSGRSSREVNSNPLQYSCLGNPIDRAWQAIVHGVTRVPQDLATKRQQHGWVTKPKTDSLPSESPGRPVTRPVWQIWVIDSKN